MPRATMVGAKEAEEAMAAILVMYTDMIEAHGGFGYGVTTSWFDRRRWDPLRLVDCEEIEGGGVGGTNPTLLQEGSAVALLCHLHDVIAEGRPLGDDVVATAILEAHRRGRFAHLPIAHEALAAVAPGTNEAALVERLAPIYEAYVIGYFRRLLRRAERR